MSKNVTYLIVAIMVIVAVVGGYFLLKPKSQSGPITTQDQTVTPVSGPDQNQTNEEKPAATVIYKDGAFNPSTVTIQKGQSVEFKNEGGVVHVASDPHPSHNGYPGFESQGDIGLGESFIFKFEKAGTFGYHNHLMPSEKGRVIVK